MVALINGAYAASIGLCTRGIIALTGIAQTPELTMAVVTYTLTGLAFGLGYQARVARIDPEIKTDRHLM